MVFDYLIYLCYDFIFKVLYIVIFLKYYMYCLFLKVQFEDLKNINYVRFIISNDCIY